MGLFDKSKNLNNEEMPIIKTEEEAVELVLGSLATLTQMQAERRGNGVYYPSIDVTIKPTIEHFTDEIVTVGFYVSSPKWGKTLFEQSTGTGKGAYDAIGTALASFLFSYIQGVQLMEEKQESDCAFETIFADNKHSWKVYRTDLVSMGQAADDINGTMYWEKLEEGLKKRLGNQTVCQVKVFAANVNGNVSGEVRVDDYVSPELTEIVCEIARGWDNSKVLTHKQFFFIRQDDETILNDEYRGSEGFTLLKSRVSTYIEILKECRENGTIEALVETAVEKMEDKNLALECYLFLPELCAGNAFGQCEYAETIDFKNDDETVTVYKNQLSNYNRLLAATLTLFNEGTFGENTNEMYSTLIGLSASYSAISQAQQNGSNLKDLRLTPIAYIINADFIIR